MNRVITFVIVFVRLLEVWDDNSFLDTNQGKKFKHTFVYFYYFFCIWLNEDWGYIMFRASRNRYFLWSLNTTKELVSRWFVLIFIFDICRTWKKHRMFVYLMLPELLLPGWIPMILEISLLIPRLKTVERFFWNKCTSHLRLKVVCRTAFKMLFYIIRKVIPQVQKE